MAFDLGSAAGLIRVGYDGAGVQQAMRDMDALGAKGRSLGADLDTVGKGLAAVAAGGLLGFKSVISAASDFDKQISAIASVGGKEAVARIDEIDAAALQLGKDTAFSASEAAAGMEELIKAGLPVGDVLDGVARAALDLSAATGAAVPAVATQMGQLLNVFGDGMIGFIDQGAKATHVADLLAQTANASATDVGEVGFALAQAANVADSFGISIEDTTAAIGLFANAGLKGSDAGTSFKTMLLALLDPTDKQAAAMNQLGLDFYDANGAFIGFSETAELLQTQLSGLTEEQRQTALAVLFGSDAYRAAKILADEGAEGLAAFQEQMGLAGTVSEQAATRLDLFAGDTEMLKGSIETAAIVVGKFATEALRPVVQSVTAAVNAFLELPEPVQRMATVLAAGATAVAAVGGAAALAGPRILEFASALKNVLSLSRLAGVAFGPVGLGLAVIGAAVVAYQKNLFGFGDAVDAAFGNVGKVVGEAVKFFGRLTSKGFNPLLAGAKALARGLNRTFGQNPVTRFVRDSVREVQDLIGVVGRFAAAFESGFDISSALGLDPLNAFFNGLRGAISAIGSGNPVADFFIRIVDQAQRFANFVRGDVLPVIGSLADYFRNTAEGGDWLNDALMGIPEGLRPVVTFFGTIVGAVSEVIAAFQRGGLGAAVRVFLSDLGEIGAAGRNLVGQLAGLAFEAVKAIGAALLDAVGRVDWDAVGRTLRDGLDFAWTWIRDHVPALARQAFDWIQESIRKIDWGAVWTSIKDALGAAKDRIALSIPVAVDWVGGQIQKVWDWLTDDYLDLEGMDTGGVGREIDIGDVSVLLTWLKDKIDPLKTWLYDNVVTPAKEGAIRLGGWLLEVGPPLLRSAVDLAGAVKDGILGLLLGGLSTPDAGNNFAPTQGRGLLVKFTGWLLDVGLPAAGSAAVTLAAGVGAAIGPWIRDKLDGLGIKVADFGDWLLETGFTDDPIGSVADLASKTATGIEGVLAGAGIAFEFSDWTMTVKIGTDTIVFDPVGIATAVATFMGEAATAIKNGVAAWAANLSPATLLDVATLGTKVGAAIHNGIGAALGAVAEFIRTINFVELFKGVAAALAGLMSTGPAFLTGLVVGLITGEEVDMHEIGDKLRAKLDEVFVGIPGQVAGSGDIINATPGLIQTLSDDLMGLLQSVPDYLSTKMPTLDWVAAATAFAGGIKDAIVGSINADWVNALAASVWERISGLPNLVAGLLLGQPAAIDDAAINEAQDKRFQALPLAADLSLEVGRGSTLTDPHDYMGDLLDGLFGGGGSSVFVPEGEAGGTSFGGAFVGTASAELGTLPAAVRPYVDLVGTQAVAALSASGDGAGGAFVAAAAGKIGLLPAAVAPYTALVAAQALTALRAGGDAAGAAFTAATSSRIANIAAVIGPYIDLVATQTPPRFAAIGTQAGTLFTTAVAAGFGNLAAAIEPYLDLALEAVRGYAAQFEAAGAAIAEGLAAGMESAKGRVDTAAAGLALAAKKAIDAEAQIASPSQVAVAQGHAITQGLAWGIRDATPAVEAAVNEVLQAIYWAKTQQERISLWESLLPKLTRPQVDEVLQDLKGLSSEAGRNLTAGFRRLVPEFRDAGASAGQAFATGMNQALPGLDDTFGLDDVAAKRIAKMEDRGRNAEAAWTRITGMFGDTEWLRQVWANSGYAEAGAEMGRQLGTSLAAGMTAGATEAAPIEAAASAEALAMEAARAINGMGLVSYEAAKETGVALGNGLIDGVRSKIAEARAVAAELANAASGSLADAAEVASPSRLTRRIGQDFGLGFALGIGQMEAASATAGARLSTTAANALASHAAASRGLDRRWGSDAVARMASDAASRAERDGGWRGPSHVEATVVVDGGGIEEIVLGTALIPLLGADNRAPLGRGR